MTDENAIGSDRIHGRGERDEAGFGIDLEEGTVVAEAQGIPIWQIRI